MKYWFLIIFIFTHFLILAQEQPSVPKFLLSIDTNPIKEKPDRSSKNLTVALKGSKIEVIEILDEFIHCTYNGIEGYAMKSRISQVDLEGVKEYFDYVEKIKNEARFNANKEESDKRLKYLIEKYGEQDGRRVFYKSIWIGMTELMLIDSWGQPKEINNTVTKYGTKKQFVYGNGRFVYVENGKVEAWQN
jgi:hypothetical protein